MTLVLTHVILRGRLRVAGGRQATKEKLHVAIESSKEDRESASAALKKAREADTSAREAAEREGATPPPIQDPNPLKGPCTVA